MTVRFKVKKKEIKKNHQIGTDHHTIKLEPSHSIKYDILPSGVTRFPITRKPSPDSIRHSVLKKLRSGTILDKQNFRFEVVDDSFACSSVKYCDGFENISELKVKIVF